MIDDIKKSYKDEFNLDVEIKTISKEEYDKIEDGNWQVNEHKWGGSKWSG